MLEPEVLGFWSSHTYLETRTGIVEETVEREDSPFISYGMLIRSPT